MTLFDRMIESYPKDSTILRTQYRMNNLIMDFSSQEIYDGLLKADKSVASRTMKDFVSEKQE